ncbi:MAG: hypothetical protein P8Z42_14705 [Anaerolineales bacterium]
MIDKNGHFQILPTSMDYPERFPGPASKDNPITGGMGSISPHPMETPALMEMAAENIVKPLVTALREKNMLRPCLVYPGCFLSFDDNMMPTRIRVCEINIRPPEPEWQPIVRRIRNLGALIRATVEGRLNDANRGVELLTTQDIGRARILAAEMDGLNYQRRLITRQVLQAALAQVERDPSLLDYRALIVAGHNWHPGVLGLVASRLAGQFERPAIALSLSDDDPAPGCPPKRSNKSAVRFRAAWISQPGTERAEPRAGSSSERARGTACYPGSAHPPRRSHRA